MKRALVLSILWSLFVAGPAAAAPEQFPLPCTAQALRGTWAVVYSGWALFPQPGAPLPLVVPGTITGVMTIGRSGAVSGRQTVVVAGVVTDYDILSGTVQLDADCTGTLLTALTDEAGNPAGEAREKITFLPDRQEISAMILGTSPGPVGAMGVGTWRRLPFARLPQGQ